MDLIFRFLQKVKFSTPSACWIWQASTVEDGYGQIRSGGTGSKMLKAHRVSWELRHGPIPNGMGVLHSCDNPPCVNPSHLFLGTPDDNQKDAVRKGRQTRGEKIARATTTERQAISVKTMFIRGMKQTTIGKALGLTKYVVSQIIRGKTWKHVHAKGSF